MAEAKPSPGHRLLLYLSLTYLLTPRCRVLLEKLTGLQLVKKFPAFHGTRRFITALTSVRHLSLSWASPIQSIYPHHTLLEIHPNIIHPTTTRSPHWSLSLRFPHQDLIHPPLLTSTRHMLTFDYLIYISDFTQRTLRHCPNTLPTLLRGYQLLPPQLHTPRL